MRLEVYASTVQEVQQVRNSKDLPGLASFEQELKQTMRRQRGSRNNTLTLPSGKQGMASSLHTHALSLTFERYVDELVMRSWSIRIFNSQASM